MHLVSRHLNDTNPKLAFRQEGAHNYAEVIVRKGVPVCKPPPTRAHVCDAQVPVRGLNPSVDGVQGCVTHAHLDDARLW
jgi:hypothetical protein